MLQRDERDTEILLGNKQLLGLFVLGAVLLGAAFAGGYMVVRGNTAKKPANIVATMPPEGAATDTASTNPATGGETHSVGTEEPATINSEPPQTDQAPLGSSKHKTQLAATSPTAAPAPDEHAFAPQSGQEFLQVAAVPHVNAVAVASVLRKKGFHAHAVEKQGTPLYRVIIGPIRSAGELSSTRDSLRKAGFNQVLVQHY